MLVPDAFINSMLQQGLIQDLPGQEEYYTRPTEIHSRMMEVRRYLNKRPGEKITNDEYQEFKRSREHRWE